MVIYVVSRPTGSPIQLLLQPGIPTARRISLFIITKEAMAEPLNLAKLKAISKNNIKTIDLICINWQLWAHRTAGRIPWDSLFIFPNLTNNRSPFKQGHRLAIQPKLCIEDKTKYWRHYLAKPRWPAYSAGLVFRLLLPYVCANSTGPPSKPMWSFYY